MKQSLSEDLYFKCFGFGPDDNIKDVIDYNNNESKVGDKTWFQSAIDKMPQTSLWMVREAGSFDTFEKRDMEESLDTFMRKINMVVLQDTLGYVFKEKSFLLQVRIISVKAQKLNIVGST